MTEKLPLDLKGIRLPLDIRYLDIENDDFQSSVPADFEGLLIFQSDTLPVGQLYIEKNDGSFDPQPALEKSVDPRTLAHLDNVRSASLPHLEATIVICTRDRPEQLRRCLASIPEQSLRPTEVIVVDNGSQGDATRLVVEKSGATYVREDRTGLDFARNAGVRATRTPIIAFTDDDVVLHRNWLENLVKAFDREDISCVTGLVLPGELTTPAQMIFERHWSFGRGYLRIDFDQAFYSRNDRHGAPVWEIGAGASQAFRRDIFDKVGLFDIRLDMGAAGCCGDSEFWNRILHYGHVCRYEPSAVCWHFHRKDMIGLSRQLRQYMSGHTAALMAQYQHTGKVGNLRRLFLVLPNYYLRKTVSRVVSGRTSDTVMLRQEILGCFGGILYLLRRWKVSAW